MRPQALRASRESRWQRAANPLRFVRSHDYPCPSRYRASREMPPAAPTIRPCAQAPKPPHFARASNTYFRREPRAARARTVTKPLHVVTRAKALGPAGQTRVSSTYAKRLVLRLQTHVASRHEIRPRDASTD